MRCFGLSGRFLNFPSRLRHASRSLKALPCAVWRVGFVDFEQASPKISFRSQILYYRSEQAATSRLIITMSTDAEDQDGNFSEEAMYATNSEPDDHDYQCLEYSNDRSSYYFKQLKANFARVLDSVDEHSLGSFAASGKLMSTPNPGLFVQDVGLVGLPLSQPVAEAIARASHRAPFGQGTETVVDTAVRNIWELNPSQFELQNPDWLLFVKGLKAHIGKGLGIANGTIAMELQPYKLILYEEGAVLDKLRE